MPEYLPLCAFRQGLLPGDCASCAWWLAAGSSPAQGKEAAGIRHEWLTNLEHEWGHVGLLANETGHRRDARASSDPMVTACVHFAPALSVPRMRELPFPPLPPQSALLFCLQTVKDTPWWTAKRVIRRALYELRRRGVEEVYAVARHSSTGDGETPDCRFFAPEMLADNGFAEVADSGHLVLMRVDNRGLVSLLDQAEAAIRRVFAREEEPAPSPAAWAGREQ